MNKDFNTKEICAICGHRLGVHKAEDYSCPKDIGRAGEFLETKFTRISSTTEQTELSIWSTSKEDDLWKDLFHDVFNGMMPTEELQKKYSITRKEEVPEAVEFAEWCVENLQPMFDEKRKFKFWIKNSGIHEKDISTVEAYTKFQLFKQKP